MVNYLLKCIPDCDTLTKCCLLIRAHGEDKTNLDLRIAPTCGARQQAICTQDEHQMEMRDLLGDD